MRFREKLSYGAAGMTEGIVNAAVGFYSTPFLLDVAGLRGRYVSAILLATKVVDGATDPLVGVLVDRTPAERFNGKRRPWLMFAIAPLAVAFAAFWQVPPVSVPLLVGYYAILTVLIDFFSTCVSIPYGALLAVLPSSYEERTSLSVWKHAFAMLANIIGPVGVSAMLAAFSDEQLGYSIAGLIFGAVALVPMLAFVITLREPLTTGDEDRGKINDHTGPRPTLIKAVYDSVVGPESPLQCPPFRIIAAANAVSLFSQQLFQAQLVLLLRALDVEDLETYILGEAIVLGILCLPLWQRLAEYSKRRAYQASCALFIIPSIALLLIEEGDKVAVHFVFCLFGVAGGGLSLMPFAILPDICASEEAQTGVDRSGSFFAFFFLILKITGAISLSVGALVLDLAGYISGDDDDDDDIEQPDSVTLALRLMLGALPIVTMSIVILILQAYRLEKTEVDEAQALLGEKRASVEIWSGVEASGEAGS